MASHKATFLRAQELSSVVCRKSSRAGWKPVWLSKDLLRKLRSKKEMHSQWEQGQVTWGVDRDTVQVCGDGIRKTKVKLEQGVARDVKNNRKGFCKYIGQIRKDKKSVLLLRSKKGELMAMEIEKAEVF